MSRVDLHFPNASCAHCVRLVTRSLERVDGVQWLEADKVRGGLAVGFDPSRVSVETIVSTMEESGYPTRLLSPAREPLPARSYPQRAA